MDVLKIEFFITYYLNSIIKKQSVRKERRMSLLANKNPHPRDANIHFVADSHTYTIHDQKYMSVTTWNHQHFAAFEADAIIAKMRLNNPTSKYFGQTPEQIKAGWEKERDMAAEAGTRMHYEIECYYNNLSVSLPLHPSCIELSYFQQFVEYFTQTFPHHKPYRTEWMIYHEELQMAGSIDMVFENELDGSLFIYDWKRTKEIKKQCSFMNFATTECINHLPDTNYWHYALQLNTYKAILEEKYNKKITDLVLVVLHPLQKKYQLVPVPLLTAEINDLFALRKRMLNA